MGRGKKYSRGSGKKKHKTSSSESVKRQNTNAPGNTGTQIKKIIQIETESEGSSVITESDLRRKQLNESTSFYHLSNFLSRLDKTNYIFIVLCFIGLVCMYLFTPLLNVFTIIISLIFAGLLSSASTFLNQHRFHYRFLFINESVSRFVSVLASSLMGRILRLGEISEYIPFWLTITYIIFFISAILFYCISVYFTNHLKNIIADKNRHTCEPRAATYSGGSVFLEEGFGQKVCTNTEDQNWYILRNEMDLITNRNIKVFLFFLLVTIILINTVSIQGLFNALPVPPVYQPH